MRSASPASRRPAPAIRAPRDAALSLVRIHRIGFAPGDGLLPPTCRAGGFLQWRVRDERPSLVQDRYPEAPFGKKRVGGSAPAEANQSFVTSSCLEGEYSGHYRRKPLPVGGVLGQLSAALFRNGIKLGLAIVVRGAPFGRDPPSLLKPHERSINGSLVQQDFIAAHLLAAPGDAVPMQLAQGIEGAEDHEIEGPLKKVQFSFAQTSSCGDAT